MKTKEELLNEPFNSEETEEAGTPAGEVEENAEASAEVEAPQEAAAAESEESEEEPKRVTYSRFKNVHAAKEEAERQAQEALQQAEYWKRMAELKNGQPSAPQADVPDYWLEMYGDNDVSRKAWDTQRKANEQLIKEAREEAVNAYREQKNQEASAQAQNLQVIESEIESLEGLIGRPLTDKEQDMVLDIVDDYTPKDAQGNYLGAMLPFDKAWEIYELKSQASKAPKKNAREAVAATSSASTQGDTSVAAVKDEEFNPRDWNAWKKRL